LLAMIVAILLADAALSRCHPRAWPTAVRLSFYGQGAWR
jgi:hypothetical protein